MEADESPYPQPTLTYLGNVMIATASEFYADHGVKRLRMHFEKQPIDEAVVMFCKHCLRYSNGLVSYKTKWEVTLQGTVLSAKFERKAIQAGI